MHRTVDDVLADLRSLLPYSIFLEVYTDVDDGWDVYVNGDLPGWEEHRGRQFHACRPSLLEALEATLTAAMSSHTEWVALG
jgi:hypothetical protein